MQNTPLSPTRRRIITLMSAMGAGAILPASGAMARTEETIVCKRTQDNIAGTPRRTLVRHTGRDEDGETVVTTEMNIPIGLHTPTMPDSESRVVLSLTLEADFFEHRFHVEKAEIKIPLLWNENNTGQIKIYDVVIKNTNLPTVFVPYQDKHERAVEDAWLRLLEGEKGRIRINPKENSLPTPFANGQDAEGFAFLDTQNTVYLEGILEEIFIEAENIHQTLQEKRQTSRNLLPGDNLGDNCSVPQDDCFLTSATVDNIGLADDAFELQTLRNFRDNVLAHTKTGKKLIAEYKQTAPQIVAAICRRSDARQIWNRTYLLHILPCALMIRLGLHKLAVASYVTMVRSLETHIRKGPRETS